jgi:endonuclease/exonuclease/phosphatase family metal-dependent hydrolase
MSERGGRPVGLRITTFNVEWMNDFFYPDEPRFKTSHRQGNYTGPAIKDVPALCSRIQGTIREVDPDILGIVEGPKLPSQMEKFVQEYLKDQSGNPIYEVVASPSERTQRQYLLVKRGTATAVRTLYDEPRYGKMVEHWKFYPWGAYMPEEAKPHTFFREPLVAELQIDTRKLTIILLHIKSKYTGLKPSETKEYVEKSILARQEITSEMKKVREYLDDALTEEMTRSIVVMGDMNDGPGRDKFEADFMLQNLVDVIQGTLLNPELNVYHVLENLQTDAYSFEYEDQEEGGKKKRELIDHILMAPGMFTGTAELTYQKGSGKVEHKAWGNHVGTDPDHVRDDRPSDHRPVTCEIA